MSKIYPANNKVWKPTLNHAPLWPQNVWAFLWKCDGEKVRCWGRISNMMQSSLWWTHDAGKASICMLHIIWDSSLKTSSFSAFFFFFFYLFYELIRIKFHLLVTVPNCINKPWNLLQSLFNLQALRYIYYLQHFLESNVVKCQFGVIKVHQTWHYINAIPTFSIGSLCYFRTPCCISNATAVYRLSG